MNRYHPKLTHDHVRMIRNLLRLKTPNVWVAKLYGVNPCTVSAIKHGRLYRGVGV